jgi:hypothetical protein
VRSKQLYEVARLLSVLTMWRHRAYFGDSERPFRLMPKPVSDEPNGYLDVERHGADARGEWLAMNRKAKRDEVKSGPQA